MMAALLTASCLLASTACAQEGKEVSAARSSAEEWLKLIDAEDYSGAWNKSSADVRANTSKFAWTMIANASHLPLGAFKSRRFKAAVPEANGKTVRLDYDAAFEKDAKVSETVTMVREKDGAWRVSGYGLQSQ